MALPALPANVAAAPLIPVAQVQPENPTSTWKLALHKITELVIQLLAPFAIVAAFYAILPISFSAIVLPVIAFGAVFATSFLFASDNAAPVAIAAPSPQPPAPVQAVVQAPPVAAPVPRPVAPPLPPEATRGIINGGANCWVNSLTQLLRCDEKIMNWFMGFPDALMNIKNHTIFMPRESLFTAEDIALNPIERVPFNPTTEDLDTTSIQQVFQWVTQVPEFSLLNMAEIFSETPVAEMLPDNLFDLYPEGERAGRKRNARELIVKLRDWDLEQKETRHAAIDRMAAQPLPADFATITLANRALFRRAADQRIVTWISGVTEMDILPLNTLLSDQPINDILPDGFFERFPGAARAAQKQNAREIIEKLRAIADAEQMTAEEKQALIAKLQAVRVARPIVSLSESKTFTQNLAAYRSIFNIIDYLKENDGINLDLIFAQNVPAAEVEFEQTMHIRGLIPNRLALSFATKNMILDNCRFYQKIARLEPLERQNALRYLTFFLDKENPLSAMRLFGTYKNFFTRYETAKNGNFPVVGADSQALRIALNGRYPNIRQHVGVQEDPSEAFGMIRDLLPPELTVDLQVRRVYNTDNLPKIWGNPDGIRISGTEPSNGFIQLVIPAENATLENMMANYFDKPAKGDEPNRLIGEDNIGHDYPVIREQMQFVRGPESLWITIKRHKAERPWDFFSWILPCCFPKPLAVAVKLETAIPLPDTLEITTLDEGNVNYKLDGFVVHLGMTPNSGHYVSYKLEQNAEGESVWYEMNDSIVRRVDGKYLEDQKAQAYMPHYSRIQQP